MQKIVLVLMLLVMTAGLFGCPTTPKTGSVYSEPEAARARAQERTKELDTNIQNQK